MILKNLITPDLIFSYWVFTWFVIYYFCLIFNLFPYIKNNFNPLLALYISLFFNFLQLIFITYKTLDFTIFFKFLIMISLFKLLPIYLIRNQKMNIKKDLINILILFIFYNIYLAYKNTNFIEINKKINKSLIEKQNTTIFFAILKYFNL
jgi:hypothetical protein